MIWGAGKPSEKYGVRDFKAKFGGNLVNFGRNTWIPSEMIFNSRVRVLLLTESY